MISRRITVVEENGFVFLKKTNLKSSVNTLTQIVTLLLTYK